MHTGSFVWSVNQKHWWSLTSLSPLGSIITVPRHAPVCVRRTLLLHTHTIFAFQGRAGGAHTHTTPSLSCDQSHTGPPGGVPPSLCAREAYLSANGGWRIVLVHTPSIIHILHIHTMWSSRQQTPVLSTPGSGCSTRRPWGEQPGREATEPRALTDSCTSGVDTRKGFVSLGPLVKISAGVGPRAEIGGGRALDPASTKADEMLKQDQQQQAQPTSSTGRTGRSRRRAVLSRVRRLLSRSRSASVEPPFARLGRGPAALQRDKAPTCSHRLLDVETALGRPARVNAPPAIVARKVPHPAGVRARSDRVENFHRALDNELVSQAFGEFCKKTLSSENVEFVRQASRGVLG